MAHTKTHQLLTTLVREGGHTFLYFPSNLLGTRARVRVKGTLNGHPFATSAVPWREQEHLITVNAGMRDRMGLSGGEQVDLRFQRDETPQPELQLPEDLRAALEDTRGARAAFEQLPASHRSQYVALVETHEPFGEGPRSERVAAAVTMILQGVDPFAPLRGGPKKER